MRRKTARADLAEVAVAGGAIPGGLRIDRLLYCLRLARSRSLATRIAASQHLRINGQRVGTAHRPVRAGDILTLPTPTGVRIIRIVAIPARRGPADEARRHYALLNPVEAVRTIRIKTPDIDARIADA
ncbi:S4 domain-containing protein [Flavisphingopyxis soli]|uniref:S4 domain-containing protein n=1 Tax=Flavisphingopyxis soli TaxID=2601267 RepID=UPI002E2723B4